MMPTSELRYHIKAEAALPLAAYQGRSIFSAMIMNVKLFVGAAALALTCNAWANTAYDTDLEPITHPMVMEEPQPDQYAALSDYYTNNGELSLWESNLFNDKGRNLFYKLDAEEREMAKKYKYSYKAYIENGAPFLYFLLTEVKRRNMPPEIAFLPMVESGFRPNARGGVAYGLWQFTNQTGGSFGLKRTKTRDDFYDFQQASLAALDYLQHLYKELGFNWDLALAAYNQGEFGIKKYLRKALKDGVDKNNLSPETVRLNRSADDYLNRFHVWIDIVSYPEDYGLEPIYIPAKPIIKRVNVGNITSMKKLAEMSGVPLATLKHLNTCYVTDSIAGANEHGGMVLTIKGAETLEKKLGR